MSQNYSEKKIHISSKDGKICNRVSKSSLPKYCAIQTVETTKLVNIPVWKISGKIVKNLETVTPSGQIVDGIQPFTTDSILLLMFI